MHAIHNNLSPKDLKKSLINHKEILVVTNQKRSECWHNTTVGTFSEHIAILHDNCNMHLAVFFHILLRIGDGANQTITSRSMKREKKFNQVAFLFLLPRCEFLCLSIARQTPPLPFSIVPPPPLATPLFPT
ncbi:hypothetical protein CDAR_579181 [Caerostris darwini]|uniref:Uncharacterized protein n=1 Tax=Caerostris darwini TaxID=1538125 RepID=A0AAV4RVG3_9ARAC|nr:hypothetical protein CDAR_579181 [Caerostris darwini]